MWSRLFHVQQEGRHRQEDDRQDRAHHLLLLDLVVEHGVRGLVLAAQHLVAAEACQALRHRLLHRRGVGSGRELERHAVEGAVHVVGGGQRLVVDPEHAEAALVGHAPQAGEDELGRQRDAGHHQTCDGGR